MSQYCFLLDENMTHRAIRSMPMHLRDHLAAGRHVPGLLVVPQRMAPWQVSEELYLLWGASQPDEYQDQIVYLPLD